MVARTAAFNLVVVVTVIQELREVYGVEPSEFPSGFPISSLCDFKLALSFLFVNYETLEIISRNNKTLISLNCCKVEMSS